ncbi:KinB-signaling pathway activation protein [Halobacillus sp. Marseille-Q1614]|uniref:KinB-signaling pathway activation protein n=1 Tax=Halobacillus sp. Marseille-Q1614 TaxID=2709134 RepID=UPI00156DAEA1|nr:KinB-signaling pathway activation protein [Halobacillus sp. Marseille-Q1614]
MNSRKWVRLFLTTLLIGGVLTLVSSFIIKKESYAAVLQPFQIFELLGLLLFFSGLGFIFSVISQMGFFAYLTIHQFGKGLFKRSWGLIQLFLIAFVIFDLIYFRYQAADNVSVWPYVFTSLGLFVVSLAVAWKKTQETNRQAFVPALFFMVVVTSVEWVPALRAASPDYVWLMIIPLVICNAYQLLILHRLTRDQPAAK